MSTAVSTSSNEALAPLPADRRVFRWHDHASLWFSLGVGLLVMQMGAFLMPAMGTQQALLAIVCGSVIGAGLLGWGTFELVVMRDATVAIGRQSGVMGAAWWPVAATLLWGGVVALLISASMVQLVRRVIARVALPLVVLSLLWLSWQFLSMANAQGLQQIWQRPGTGGMGVMPALDLVIAMPISWLPLVADYARHGISGKSALRGTWLGYALANMWCYSLGVLVALTLPSQDLVTALLLAQGGLIALSLILIDEVDNAYGDTYSGAVSAHSLWPRMTVRRWGLVVAVLCTALALVLPMHSLEPFLLMLSSVFVPLFGVILGRLALGVDIPAQLQRASAVHWVPVALWLGGIVLYYQLPKLLPGWGSALPTLGVCFALARLTRPR